MLKREKNCFLHCMLLSTNQTFGRRKRANFKACSIYNYYKSYSTQLRLMTYRQHRVSNNWDCNNSQIRYAHIYMYIYTNINTIIKTS